VAVGDGSYVRRDLERLLDIGLAVPVQYDMNIPTGATLITPPLL
jgi:hypothetical protein